MFNYRSACLFLAAASSFVFGGCNDSSSGACTGKLDGEIYYVRAFNCTRSDLTVRVNDRDVGTVEPASEDGECSYTDLGAFPQCDSGEVHAYGNALITDNEFEWNEDALELNKNGCWLVFTVIDPAYTDYEMPEDVTPNSDPLCLYLD